MRQVNKYLKTNQGIAKWQERRNLLFYNGLQPTNFYFDLLINSRWEGHDEYNSIASNIGKSAKNKIESAVESLKIFSSNQGEKEEKDRLNIIIPLLDKAIAYEQNNELTFFKQKYQDLIANFNEEQIKNNNYLTTIANFFKNFDPTAPFEYEKFTAIVNILLSGLDNAKFSLKYEEERLTNMEEKLSDLKLKVGRRAKGLAQKQHKDQEAYKLASGKRLQIKLRNQYLLHGNLKDANGEYLRDLRGRLADLKGTIDVEVSNWINDHLQAALKDPQIKKQIAALIINDNNILSNPVTAAENVTQFLIKELVKYGINNISTILSKKVAEKTTLEILNDIMQVPQSKTEIEIEGVYSNIFEYGNKLKFFDPNGKNSAEGLYDAINKLYNDMDNKRIRKEMSGGRIYVKKIFEKDENLLKFRDLIKEMEKIIKKIQENVKESEAQYKLILDTPTTPKDEHKIFTLNIKNGTITNLTELTSILKNYAKELGFDLDKGIRQDSLRGLVSSLKGKFSIQVKQKLESIIEKGVDPNYPGLNTKAKIKAALRKGLENTKVQVSAPKISELAQFLTIIPSGNTVKLIWTGPHNAKNDSVEITITTPTTEIRTQLMNIFSTNIDNLDSNIMELFVNAKKEMAKDMGESLVSQINNNVDKHRYHQYELTAKRNMEREQELLSLNEESLKRLEKMPNVKELLNLIRSNNKNLSEEQIKRKETQLLKTLLDFFFVSSTVKTYNNYMNNYGFLGGSLGGNVTKQLETLNKFFTAAGAPLQKNDMDWLIGAIINCSSHSVVGTKYKQDIEYYLGSIAIFSLFDEGLIELNVIKNINNITAQPTSSMRMVHIYRLSGGYYTGSFVLQKARDSLATYIQQIQSLPEQILNNKQQGGVAILGGGVTPKDLPNKGLSIPEETDPWGKISNLAKGRAKIQVLFMAGLLQTLNKINQEMSEIEFPK